ncbi:MAG: class I SAM-dependent rRNA methyltransferase, partial [Clostridia bacterium]|nr:class I SAM-dependent rRNA methyltransferase [Clostridia bacterium]
DCFTHTGSFALNAALGGAKHVTAVDISADAIEMAKRNAERNGLTDRMDFIATDVFDLLPTLAEKKHDYDFVILDPPAFTKNRKTVKDAIRGYKEINYRAMKLLPRGGFLATCSCSHFMEPDAFVDMLQSAARDAGVQLKLIEARRQSPDHPVVLGIGETDYLKFYLFQVI